MMMMVRAIEPLRCVALRAYSVSRFVKFSRMRIVAVRACHAGSVHLALDERTVVEDLVVLLPVGMVEPPVEG
jgi:hypothetical protein